jgi:hypothetical protein
MAIHRCIKIWDPKVAAEKGWTEMSDPLETVHHSKKEMALIKVVEADYNFDALEEIVKSIAPVDGSDWPEEKKTLFHQEIFRVRKDMEMVCKTLDIPMVSALTYYLGSFKPSDDYRLLKTVIVDERLGESQMLEFGYDSCAICGDGGSLVICDGCEGEYHLSCLKPPLRSVPEGHWECDECVDTKLIAGRNYIITKTGLFEHIDAKKRKADDLDESNDNESDADIDIYRPSEKVLSALKVFCSGISSTLQKPQAVTAETEEQ